MISQSTESSLRALSSSIGCPSASIKYPSVSIECLSVSIERPESSYVNLTACHRVQFHACLLAETYRQLFPGSLSYVHCEDLQKLRGVCEGGGESL